jgi:hypothetical protein
MITRRNQVIFRGKNDARPSFDTSKPEVVRLDQDFDNLRHSAGDVPLPNVALRLARGLAGYEFVYKAAVGPGVDLFSFMQDLLEATTETTEPTRQHFSERDVSTEILGLVAQCVDALGTRPGPQPFYYVLYGHPSGTNAKTFNSDQVTGRPQVLFESLLSITGCDGLRNRDSTRDRSHVSESCWRPTGGSRHSRGRCNTHLPGTTTGNQ